MAAIKAAKAQVKKKHEQLKNNAKTSLQKHGN